MNIGKKLTFFNMRGSRGTQEGYRFDIEVVQPKVWARVGPDLQHQQL